MHCAAKLVSDTGAQSADGGRTKPELHRTIVKLGQLYLSMNAVGAASVLKKPKIASEDKAPAPVPVAVSVPAVPIVVTSSVVLAVVPLAPVVAVAAVAVAVGPESSFVPVDHGYDVECVRPLPPDDKPVPTLQSLGLSRFSFAFGVASNEFAFSVYDSCCCVAESIAKRRAGPTEEELSSVGKALLLNTRLRKIVLPFSGIGDKELSLLFGPCIEHGHRLGLTVLDLRHNALSKTSCAMLASVVALCPNLQRLMLEDNDLKEAGLTAIFKSLPPSLTMLSFSKCTDKIAVALAGELKLIPNLCQLCLRDGSITDAGLSKLCAALVAQGPSSQLYRLDLRRNSITAKSLPVLVDAMHKLGSLWWIQDEDNSMGAAHPSTLRDTAREKFRVFMPSSHPAVDLQTMVTNDHQFAAASPQRSLETVCACLAVGLDVTAALAVGTLSPLHCAAAYFGDGYMLELLLAAPGGRQAITSDDRGRDLLRALPSMSPENLRLLLENGMRPGSGASGGIPYIVGLATYAWTKGQSKDVRGWLYRLKLLLTLDASCVNATDADGETALSVLARSSYAEVVDLLLHCGADVKSRDKSFHNTPLHWACKYGHPGTARTLLKCSDLNSKNAAGETPLDVAKKYARAQVELELRAVLRDKK